MRVTVEVSEIGWEKEISINDQVPVHRILYELLDEAQKEGVNRASDIYGDMASYGLYYQPTTTKSLEEMVKERPMKINALSEAQKLFVLHRGIKITQFLC